jgi:hypothetical protein
LSHNRKRFVAQGEPIGHVLHKTSGMVPRRVNTWRGVFVDDSTPGEVIRQLGGRCSAYRRNKRPETRLVPRNVRDWIRGVIGR